MKLREIVDDEKLSSSEKLVALNEIINKIRTTYGNDNIEIKNEGVNTSKGIIDIGLLSADDKLKIAEIEFDRCITYAVEHCKCTPGAILDKEIESNVAVNDVLANIMAESGSSYI